MRLALDRAGVRPHDVDVVLPDALGVPALRPQRGRRRCGRCSATGPPPVTTQKPLTGRAHQGGSALDVATALLAFRHDTAARLGRAGRAGRRLRAGLPAASPAGRAAGIALVGARGFDGFNSALVLRGAAPPPPSQDRA